MLIIPAIDLKDGECVRLRRGDMGDATVYGADPVAMAQRWVDAGARRLHLVDLNGAFAGEPVNRDAVTAIAARFPDLPIQIGGGVRNLDCVEFYMSAGVRWVIIGTSAVTDPEFVAAACRAFPGRIIVGLDAVRGMVATDGWATVTDIAAVDLGRGLRDAGVSEIVYTDIDRDGMMQGVNVEETAALAEAVSIPVIASGGITNLDDVRALHAQSARGISGAITGRAIYEGTLDLAAAQRWCDEQH